MQNDAYRFSVRDDTSFRVNEGETESALSIVPVTIVNRVKEDETPIEIWLIVSNVETDDTIGRIVTTRHLISADATDVVNVITIDGVGYLSLSSDAWYSESTYTGDIEVVMIDEQLIYKVTGEGTITIQTPDMH